MDPVVPRYGLGSLSDVVPSLLAGMGVPGMVDVLGVPPARKVCLLLVDGLGWHLLRQHAAEAPFLTELAAARAPITAGFPATTVTSLAAIGTGLPPGEHGLVGYSFAAGPGEDDLLNALRWHSHGPIPPVDLRSVLVPEEIQPQPTAFERATDAGVAVRLVAPAEYERSGLTRAVLRGGRYDGVHALGDLVARTLAALNTADRVLCYAYHADLDALGHVYGPGSDPWRHQLAFVDRLAAAISEDLPRDAVLVVTADHGMVTMQENDRVDFDTDDRLRDGVRLLGGEARVRHVYTTPGATADVHAQWAAVLGDRAWIATRDQAIAAGWFGPTVAHHLLPRIGDLVVACRDSTGVVRTAVEPLLSSFLGQHGSLTADEQLVPLLVTHSTS